MGEITSDFMLLLKYFQIKKQFGESLTPKKSWRSKTYFKDVVAFNFTTDTINSFYSMFTWDQEDSIPIDNNLLLATKIIFSNHHLAIGCFLIYI